MIAPLGIATDCHGYLALGGCGKVQFYLIFLLALLQAGKRHVIHCCPV
jgi:hypothetical protein